MNTQKKVIAVGTHHKTGTHWLRHIFRIFCEKSGKQFVFFPKVAREAGLTDENAKIIFFTGLCAIGYDVFFEEHCIGFKTAAEKLGEDRFKCFHIVRDPRDIMISGANYHLNAKEEWLLQPDEAFAGKTYQEKINEYISLDDRVLFEAEHCGLATVKEIAQTLMVPNIQTFRYEDLMNDLGLFDGIFEFCEFEQDNLETFRKVVEQQSITGGLDKSKVKAINDGSNQQWKRKLKDSTIQVLNEKFGNLIKVLGYEI